MHDRIRRLSRLLGIDRAVFYTVALRAWQFTAGPVTALLIAGFFHPDIQGYYYLFASLLAAQSFLELGFHVVILNAASHEWAKLDLDPQSQITGDADAHSRLISLGRLVFLWYAIVALLFVIGVGLGGYSFLVAKSVEGVDWTTPWIALVCLTALSLWSLPFHALLEGCNQVATINRFRLWQAITGNLVVWLCVPLGAGLWTTVAVAIVKVVWEAYLLLIAYRPFFKPFLRPPTGPHIEWRNDLWPLQWRLAVQGAFSYFAFWLFTPMMSVHGLAVAGQMGMTWTVLTAIQAAGLAWVQTRAPRFGMLIAEGRYEELDQLFRRLTILSLAIVTTVAAAFWGVVYGLHALPHPLAERVLAPDALAVFTLAIILYHVPHCQAFYIRAHKREMLLFAGVASSIMIGLSVWWLGGRFGPIGAGAGYLAVIGLFVLPYQTLIWRRCRAERS
ncbi:MAG: hypothetical protein CMJ64_22725 [Planctomycetaceae bacterium]|nr:hypothetical protein [Planctomycetaceae bacterium]